MSSVGKDQQQRLAQLQTHVRLSNNETKEAVRDLYDWEDEMRAKDAALQGKESGVAASRKKCRKTKPEDKQPVSKVIRIKGTDYDKWEKFSDEVEEDEAKTEEGDVVYCSSDCDCDKDLRAGDVDRADRIIEQQKLAQRAALEKDKGNAYFAKKKFSEAIKCYSDGINFDSQSTVLYANRAQALLKVKKFAAAEQDCTKALSLDSTFGKAYFRRGLSRMELNKLREAKDDFEAVLRNDAANIEAQNMLRNVLQQLTITNPDTGECKESLCFPEALRNAGADVEPYDVNVKLVNSKAVPNAVASGRQKPAEVGIADNVGEKVSEKKFDSKQEENEKNAVKKEKITASVTTAQNGSSKTEAVTKPAAYIVPAGPAPPPKPYFDKENLKRPTTIQDWLSTMKKFNGNVELIQFYCRKITHMDTPQYLYQELGTGLDFQLFSKLIDAYEQLIVADEKLDCYKHLCGLQGARRVRALCFGLKADMRERLVTLLVRLLEDDEWMQPPPPLPASTTKAEKEAEEKKYGIYGPHTIANERPDRKRHMITHEFVESFYLEAYRSRLS